jgi:phage portal protein BeeE
VPGEAEVYDYLRGLESAAQGHGRAAPTGIASGAIGYSAGGPTWLDAFRSKRPPNPYELVNAFKSVAYACVQLNANGVARVPLRLYAKTSRKQARPRRDHRALTTGRERYLRALPYLSRTLKSDDTIDEILDHPLKESLDRPNPYFDGQQFLQHLARGLDVVGASYFFPDRPAGPDGTGDPRQARKGMEVWPLQSQYVFAVKGSGRRVIRNYTYFSDEFAPHELVRVRYVSLRDPYMSPYSPLHACFEQTGLGDYYTAVVESMLKTGARPSLLVSPKDPNRPMGEPERKRFEADINNRFAQGRQGSVWVADGTIDVNQITYPPADLAGLEITRYVRLICANCFDVPISLLQAEDTNRAVASEGTHQHQYYAIAPRCVLIAAALTQQFAQPVDDRLFFAFDDPVQRDVERDAKVMQIRVGAGLKTINEERAEEGLPPVAWGDEPWLPQTLVQPSVAEEMRQARQAAREALVAAKTPQPDAEETPDRVDTKVDGADDARSWERFGRALELLERELAE